MIVRKCQIQTEKIEIEPKINLIDNREKKAQYDERFIEKFDEKMRERERKKPKINVKSQ